MTLGGVDPRKETYPVEPAAPVAPRPDVTTVAPPLESVVPAQTPESDAWNGRDAGPRSRMALGGPGYSPLASRPDPTEVARAGGRAPVVYDDPAQWQRQDIFQREVLVSALKGDDKLMTVLQNWSAMPEATRLAALERMSAKMGEVYGFTPLGVRASGEPGPGGESANGEIALHAGALEDPRQAIALVGHMQAHAYQGQVTADPAPHMQVAAAQWRDAEAPAGAPDSAEAWVAARTRPSQAHAWQLGDSVAYQLIR